MRKMMMYVCFATALVFLLGSFSMLYQDPQTIGELPYGIAWSAVFLRFASILRAPKDSIAFWKRFIIGLGKLGISLFGAVLLSSLCFNWDSTAQAWVFCILFIPSMFYLKSERVLKWFKNENG